MTTILLAEDDASLRFVLSQALSKDGYVVRATTSASALAKWVRDGEGDLVLTDVYLGEDCVFDTLPGLRSARPNLPVIVMSAQSTVATALSATAAGAFDYLPKPFDLDALLLLLRRALAGAPDAQSRAQAGKAEREEKLALIGRSAAMQDVYRTIARVAGSELNVLIEGESGAGKGRAARALHDFSRRAQAPFLTLSVAGADAAQLEAEVSAKLLEAEGGTLLIEHVDDLPADAQTRLIGLLQRAERANVRLIAAAQRSLAALVNGGGFRRDLFYRLNVVSLRLPPLRERTEDIGDLARAFLLRAKREGVGAKTLDAGAVARLSAHDWPGNIRELENLLKRLISLSPANVINAADIDRELRATARPAANAQADEGLEAALAQRLADLFAAAGPDLPPPGLYDRVLAEIERPLIRHALKATRGNQIRAAAVLGINRNTLRKKIQGLGLVTGWDD